MYYLEKLKGRWVMKMAVKLKGVRAEARKMGILEDINKAMVAQETTLAAIGEIDTLPV